MLQHSQLSNSDVRLPADCDGPARAYEIKLRKFVRLVAIWMNGTILYP